MTIAQVNQSYVVIDLFVNARATRLLNDLPTVLAVAMGGVHVYAQASSVWLVVVGRITAWFADHVHFQSWAMYSHLPSYSMAT